MSSDYGFIYFLSNDSMPGIYKIGFTARHPKTRAKELSCVTGCPVPFEILAYFGTDQPEMTEQSIHFHLGSSRVNSAREFFKCDLATIREVVEMYSWKFDDAVFRRTLDDMILVEEYERLTAAQPRRRAMVAA